MIKNQTSELIESLLNDMQSRKRIQRPDDVESWHEFKNEDGSGYWVPKRLADAYFHATGNEEFKQKRIEEHKRMMDEFINGTNRNHRMSDFVNVIDSDKED